MAVFFLLVMGWPAPDPVCQTQERIQRPQERLQVTVDRGRLSVDLLHADVRKVLAQIGQQTGIVFRVGSGVKGTVSVQFTDLELDQGLRRLLRLASLSSVMVHAQGSTGANVLKEVQVFGEALGNPGLPPMVAEAQMPASPPAAGGENDAASRLREALGRTGEQSPPASAPSGGESDAASRLREALEGARVQTPPPPSAGNDSDAARRIGDALRGATGGPEQQAR